MGRPTKSEKKQVSPRFVALYLTFIAIPSVLFLYLSVHSVQRQWHALHQENSAENATLGRDLVATIERRTTQLAQECLRDPRVPPAKRLAAVNTPEEVFDLRKELSPIEREHQIALGAFVVSNGEVRYPLLNAPSPRPLARYLDAEKLQATNLLKLFVQAERSERKNPAAAARLYDDAYHLAAIDSVRALALYRSARAWQASDNQAQAENAFATLEQNYGDLYDPAYTPYHLAVLFAHEHPDKEALLATYEDFVNGRWEVSATQVDTFMREFRMRLGADMPEMNTKFLARFAAARTLQEALRGRQNTGLMLRVRLTGPEGGRPRVGDEYALAISNAGGNTQTYYRILSTAPGQNLLWGFAVNMEYMERNLLPALGGGDTFWVNLHDAKGRTSPQIRFQKIFPFVQLTVIPQWARRRSEQGDTLILTGSIVLMCLMGLGFYILNRDIRHQRELTRIRRDFISGVSHELKTPTTLIRLYAETLVEDESVPIESRERCRIIAQEAMRLTQLVENTLDFSRLERGAHTYNLQPGDLRQVVANTLAPCREYLDSKGFILGGDLRQGLPLVAFDPEAVPSLVLNLIDNAVKYSGKSNLIRVDLFAEGNNVVLAVEDHGIGIALSERERIFEPFYRVDIGASRGGCGLGLYLVKSIMEGHGGRVDVRSELHKGTCFRLIFPACMENKEVRRVETAFA